MGTAEGIMLFEDRCVERGKWKIYFKWGGFGDIDWNNVTQDMEEQWVVVKTGMNCGV